MARGDSFRREGDVWRSSRRLKFPPGPTDASRSTRDYFTRFVATRRRATTTHSFKGPTDASRSTRDRSSFVATCVLIVIRLIAIVITTHLGEPQLLLAHIRLGLPEARLDLPSRAPRSDHTHQAISRHDDVQQER